MRVHSDIGRSVRVRLGLPASVAWIGNKLSYDVSVRVHLPGTLYRVRRDRQRWLALRIALVNPPSRVSPRPSDLTGNWPEHVRATSLGEGLSSIGTIAWKSERCQFRQEQGVRPLPSHPRVAAEARLGGKYKPRCLNE